MIFEDKILLKYTYKYLDKREKIYYDNADPCFKFLVISLWHKDLICMIHFLEAFSAAKVFVKKNQRETFKF